MYSYMLVSRLKNWRLICLSVCALAAIRTEAYAQFYSECSAALAKGPYQTFSSQNLSSLSRIELSELARQESRESVASSGLSVAAVVKSAPVQFGHQKSRHDVARDALYSFGFQSLDELKYNQSRLVRGDPTVLDGWNKCLDKGGLKGSVTVNDKQSISVKIAWRPVNNSSPKYARTTRDIDKPNGVKFVGNPPCRRKNSRIGAGGCVIDLVVDNDALSFTLPVHTTEEDISLYVPSRRTYSLRSEPYPNEIAGRRHYRGNPAIIEQIEVTHNITSDLAKMAWVFDGTTFNVEVRKLQGEGRCYDGTVTASAQQLTVRFKIQVDYDNDTVECIYGAVGSMVRWVADGQPRRPQTPKPPI